MQCHQACDVELTNSSEEFIAADGQSYKWKSDWNDFRVGLHFALYYTYLVCHSARTKRWL